MINEWMARFLVEWMNEWMNGLLFLKLTLFWRHQLAAGFYRILLVWVGPETSNMQAGSQRRTLSTRQASDDLSCSPPGIFCSFLWSASLCVRPTRLATQRTHTHEQPDDRQQHTRTIWIQYAWTYQISIKVLMGFPGTLENLGFLKHPNTFHKGPWTLHEKNCSWENQKWIILACEYIRVDNQKKEKVPGRKNQI